MPDFDMTPYGGYVWGAYALSALVLGGLALRIWQSARETCRRLHSLEPSA